jgi:soluble lytic murein transglycosylase-like protein
MENSHPRTLAKIVRWASAAAKCGLMGVLFLPALFIAKYKYPATVQTTTETLSAIAEAVETKRPGDLTAIYTIVKSNRPGISEKEAWKVSTAILDECAKRNLDPMLVLAVIKIESNFRNRVESPMGARGIMQIMPETGRFLSEELLRVDGLSYGTFIADHLYDPIFNIKLGVYYLDGLKRQFRNLQLALLAYNLGPSEIQNRLDNNLYVSDAYAASVLNVYREFKSERERLF